jgi:membrane-associated phospholipid phosphatase
VSLDLTSRRPRSRSAAPDSGIARTGQGFASPWPGRLAIVAATFLAAFVVDMATGQRASPALGSTAILISLLALFPSLRRLALPVGAWAVLWVGFNVVRAVANDTPWAKTTIGIVPDAERGLLGSPSAVLQAAFHEPGALGPLDILTTAIHLSFFVTPHVVAAVLLVRSTPCFRRYAIAMAILLAAGAIAFALLPTAPPWLSATDEGARPVIRITDVVLSRSGLVPGTAATSEQPGNFAFEVNRLAAMPSIHLGATALIAAVAFDARRLRLAALLYCLAMGFSLVYLGEHYVLDVVVGGALASAAWWCAGRIGGPRRQGTDQPMTR